eukprot:2170319-Rhodomonas_salina.2
MSSTDLTRCGTRKNVPSTQKGSSATMPTPKSSRGVNLRACCAMSGTETAFRASCLRACYGDSCYARAI